MAKLSPIIAANRFFDTARTIIVPIKERCSARPLDIELNWHGIQLTLLQAGFQSAYDEIPSADAEYLRQLCTQYAARIQELNGGNPIDPSKVLIGDYTKFETGAFGCSLTQEFVRTLGIFDLEVNLFVDTAIARCLEDYATYFEGRKIGFFD